MFTIYEPEGDRSDESTPVRFVVPDVPEAVLESHGARVLRPSEAPAVEGRPRPRPTVYRSNVMLMPPSAVQPDAAALINGILKPAGMRMVWPDVAGEPAFVVAGLASADQDRAVTVDAWAALQLLRAAAEDMRDSDEPDDRERLLPPIIDETSLDHLLVGSALDGAGSGLLIGSGNTATNGSPELSGLFNGMQQGTSGRIPVTVVLAPPKSPVTPAGRRRPVVAVLDTGIATEPEHPWLTPSADLDRAAPAPDDAVVIVDKPFQDTIQQAAGSTEPRAPIVGYADQPSIEEPLRGILQTHAGHGTAIAGIVRQLAPAAQIYVLRVMHPYGFAHESDVCLALEWIADRVDKFHRGVDGGQMVDVVSLSLGYFHESDAEEQVTDKLRPILVRLVTMGVTVVAAAGNFATSRKFYPAALSKEVRADDRAPLISVGSLNPDSSTSMYSNEGDWVDCFASGAAVVTTFPRFTGSLNPLTTAGRRSGYDPDNFRGMWAVWSGCSFSAPGVGACIAAKLAAEAGTHDGTEPERLAARVDAAHGAWKAVREDPLFRPPAQDDPQ